MNIKSRMIFLFNNSRAVVKSHWYGTNNLAAYQISLIPPTISATITPAPNAAGWNHTNVVVHFSASSTGSGIAWVTSDITITGATNDCEVTGYAMDNAGNLVGASVFVNIDPTPPVITLDPGDGQSLDQSHPLLLIKYADSDTNVPPQIVSAGLDLSTLQIVLDSSDVTSNFYYFANGAVGNGINLVAGTHTWSATIADMAGNVTSTSVTFTATGATNANAPVMSNLDLNEGVVTVLPDMTEVWVQGKVSGDGTTVAASVNGGAPIAMNRRGEDFGYLLPLAPGTNVIVLVATATAQAQQQALRRKQNVGGDQKPPQTSRALVVERSQRFQAWVASPAIGTFANGQEQQVELYLSMVYDDGSPTGVALTNATLNGLPVSLNGTMEVAGVNYYHAVVTVPGTNTTAVPLSLTIYLANGQQQRVPLWMLEGYQIESRQLHYQNTTIRNCYQWTDAAFYWTDHNPPEVNDGVWQVEGFVLEDYQASYVIPDTLTATNWLANDIWWVTGTNVVAQPSVPSLTNLVSSYGSQCGWWFQGPTGSEAAHVSIPQVSLRFGTNDSYSETVTAYAPQCGGNLVDRKSHNQTWAGDTGEMVVRWPFHYKQGDQVLLTIEGLDYTRVAGEDFNGSNVTLTVGGATYTPAVITNASGGYGYDLSYLVSVSGSNFVLSGSTFTWPPSTTNVNYTTASYCWNNGDYTNSISVTSQETYHHLSFRGFHNCIPEILSPSGDAAKGINNAGKGWCNGGANYWFDFQGVTTTTTNWRSLVIAAADCPGEGCYNWTLDPYVGTLIPTSNPKYPAHIPPDSVPGVSAQGTLNLSGWVQKDVIIYQDHLARDMVNFQNGQSCFTDEKWTTPFGEIKMKTGYDRWNCHGSVIHAHYGTGDGTTSPPYDKTKADRHYTFPFTSNDIQGINELEWGDVVAFYSPDSIYKNSKNWIHSATSIGGPMLWGANNSATANGNETWQFATRSVYDKCWDYYGGANPATHNLTIYIFKKGHLFN